MIRCEKCGEDLEPFDYLHHACVRTGPPMRLKVTRADGRVEWFDPSENVVLGPKDRFVMVQSTDEPPSAP